MSRLMKMPEVERLVSLKKSKIYALIKSEAFPQPVKLGRSSSWVEEEVTQWIVAHASQRTTPTAAEGLS